MYLFWVSLEFESRVFVIIRVGANGVTALMRSMCHGAVDATRLLLEHGAKCTRVDNEGRGPLHHAAAAGVVPNDSVALLLAPDNGGELALSVDSTDWPVAAYL